MTPSVGAQVAHLVKPRNLDLSSGLDLWVMSSGPMLGSTWSLLKNK